MIHLLLAALPYVCWNGADSVQLAVAKAQRELGVSTQLYVRFQPPSKTPKGLDPKLTTLAWIYRASEFDWTVNIREDVRHSMGCDSLRYLALHEVCHIKLQHWIPTESVDVAVQHEVEADDCVRQQLGPSGYADFKRRLSEDIGYMEHDKLHLSNFEPSPRIPVTP